MNLIKCVNRNILFIFTVHYRFIQYVLLTFLKLKTRTTGNISVTAKWKKHDYSIITNKTGSGAISSDDKITYTKNTSVYIIPAEGYTTSSLKIDGVSITSVTKYNFLNVEADHKVEATFTISQNRKMELMQKGYKWIDLKLK